MDKRSRAGLFSHCESNSELPLFPAYGFALWFRIMIKRNLNSPKQSGRQALPIDLIQKALGNIFAYEPRCVKKEGTQMRYGAMANDSRTTDAGVSASVFLRPGYRCGLCSRAGAGGLLTGLVGGRGKRLLRDDGGHGSSEQHIHCAH